MFEKIKLKISAKKAVFIFIFFVLMILILAGGFFLYKKAEKNSTKNTLWKNEYVSDENFDITENDDGNIIESKENGLIMKAPSDWKILKEGEDIFIVSPETEFNEKGFVAFDSFKEKGACGIGIQIMKCKETESELTTFADDLRDDINRIKQYEEYKKMMENYSPKTEITLLSGKEGIKRTYIKDSSIRMIEIEVPVGQIIYSFDTTFIANEKCIDEFNKIMDTVSITN